jgi:hypothetical protein
MVIFKFHDLNIFNYRKKQPNEDFKLDEVDYNHFYLQLLKMKKKRPYLNIERILKEVYGNNIERITK